MFHEVDPVLGPEMKSTGEVLGMADSFELCFFKAQEAVGPSLPSEGSVLMSIAHKDGAVLLDTARQFKSLGFKIAN